MPKIAQRVKFDDDLEYVGTEVPDLVFKRVLPQLDLDDKHRVRRYLESGTDFSHFGYVASRKQERKMVDQYLVEIFVKHGLTDDDIRAIYRGFQIGSRGEYQYGGDMYLAELIGKVRAA